MRLETVEKLLGIHNNRKLWKRTAAVGSISQQMHPVVYRVLALRELELCVKSGVEQAFEQCVIPTVLAECYDTIIEDEINHAYQLEQLAIHLRADSFGVKCPHALVKEFENLCTKFNPLMINYVLECVVFINGLPLLQQYGDNFANTVASWILLDEARHVAFGRTYVSAMKLEVPEELLIWVFKLLSWVIESLEERKRTQIVKNAWKCLNSGVFNDKELMVIPQRISFFESDKVVY